MTKIAIRPGPGFPEQTGLRNNGCAFDPEPRRFYSVLMPHQTEPNANNALALVIRGMLPSCTVLPETTQVFPDHPGRHADVLITAQGSSPVAVESEYDPALEVEQDSRERLGLEVAREPRPIEAAIAVRYPTAVENAYDLAQAISDAQLLFCVLYDDGSRFPQSGWLTGSVTDLADLICLVSVPGKAVDAAAAALQQGIERAATLLNDMAELRPNITMDYRTIWTHREAVRKLGIHVMRPVEVFREPAFR